MITKICLVNCTITNSTGTPDNVVTRKSSYIDVSHMYVYWTDIAQIFVHIQTNIHLENA